MKAAEGQLELMPIIGQHAIGSWQPDETLFSLVSRQHAISGSPRASDTSKRFFGHATEGMGHDFPARLDTFIAQTQGALGTAEDIFQYRTILPYYMIFRPAYVRAMELQRARQGGLGDIKARLGLLAGRWGASHPLKICRVCAEKERDTTGILYWHRTHQLPGVWICLTHRVPLQLSRPRACGSGRHQWALPQYEDHRTNVSSAIGTENFEHLERLSQFITWAVEQSSSQVIDSGQLRLSLIAQLSGQPGQVTLRGVDTRRLAIAIAPYQAALANFPGHDALMGEAGVNRALRLMRSIRSESHPLWWLVLSAALLSSPLLMNPGVTSSITSRAASDPTLDTEEKRRFLEYRLLELVKGGLSATAASFAVGISTETGLTWLAKMGHGASRRHKWLTSELLTKLEGKFTAGMSQKKLSEAAGISHANLNYLLRLRPDLHMKWKAGLFSCHQQKHRQRWLSAVRNAGSSGAVAARREDPSAYSWLFDHDRAWLLQTNQRCVKHSVPSKESVQWDKRDQQLSVSVQKAILQASEEGLSGRHRKRRTYELVPGLILQQRNLHRLPLTQRSLKRI